MSTLSNLYATEISNISNEELELFKVAGWAQNIGIGAGGAALGFLGTKLLSADSKEVEEKRRKAAITQNLIAAGLGSATTLLARKPIEGLLSPDPEDLQMMESDVFDDMWKQRRKR